MPTYEFGCPNGHTFDKFWRKMSESLKELPCPVCGATAQRKVSGGAGLVFKGSGFYITDYGKDGKKTAAPPAKPGSAGESAQGQQRDGAGEGSGASAAKPAEPSSGAEKKAPSSGDSSGK